jgi:CRISPR-associated protein Csm2
MPPQPSRSPYNPGASRGGGGPPRQGGAYGQGHGGGRGGGGQEPPSPIQMPTPRKIAYFADADRHAIARDLVGKEAEALAQKIAQVPPSQIRRFYGDVMALSRRLVPGARLPNEAIQTHMTVLKAKAAYAWRRSERQPEKFPRDLLQFFSDHCESVSDQKDFEAFRQIFEAVIAYHKFFAIEART